MDIQNKYNAKGEVVKHKAIFVAKGYSNVKGIDFEETFALVARWDTLQITQKGCQKT